MKNFALVRDGLPILTATPANDADYKNGQIVDGAVWREFPLTISHHELLNEWYFYYTWKMLPPRPGQHYIWNKSDEVWQFDLATAQAAKNETIRKACEEAILAGFQSSALGNPHQYPSDLEDQANLTASVMRSTLPESDPDEVYPFKCLDMNDLWAFRPHSAAQIHQVGRDGYAAILAYRQRYALLQETIQAAATESDLQAITWD